ncbi:MAG: hypothetical protein AABX84_00940, partial [Nanoarchaeota archaeon]
NPRLLRLIGLDGSLMSVGPTFKTIFGISGSKPNIKVYPDSFGLEFNDFLSVLIDHEGYHAREIYENPSIIVPNPLRMIILSLNLSGAYDRFRDSAELRACLNELEMSKKKGRNWSDRYIRDNRLIIDSLKTSIS